jgi:hypothetical protein
MKPLLASLEANMICSHYSILSSFRAELFASAVYTQVEELPQPPNLLRD